MRTRTGVSLAVATLMGCSTILAQTPEGQDLFRAGPETYAPRYEPGPNPPPHLIFPGVYLDDHLAPNAPQAPGRRRLPATARQLPDARQVDAAVTLPADGRGVLRLLVEPGTTQIFVDGFFVGTVADYLDGEGLMLDAGPRRVELRADGYVTETFDIRILPNTRVAHRMVLAKAASTALAPPARRETRAKTFYVIAGCYAGDSPPRADQLPAGCDPSAVRAR